MTGAKKTTAPGAVAMIEEAVHLLRGHPFELALYYAGTGPFAVALLYAWARVTWFAPDGGAVALGALGLTLLFGVMKLAQHRFARRLYAFRAGEPVADLKWREVPAALAAEFRLQTAGVAGLPLASLFAVPFGWLYAYFQSATVVSGGDAAERRREAWEQALLWPKQNHQALAIFSGLWFVMFINIAAAFYAVPMLATQFLGLKTIFAISGWAYFNTTLLLLLTVLTHLAVDPLIKTFYVLRVFHGRARHTGADIRLVLTRERQLRATAARVALILVALGLAMPGYAFAADASARAALPPGRVESGPTVAKPRPPPAALDRAIDEALTQPEFEWRLRPLPKQKDDKPDGPMKSFARATLNTIQQMFRTVGRWIDGVKQWFADLFPDRETVEAESGAREGKPRNLDWMNVLQIGAYVLLFVVLGVLLFVAWRVWRHNRNPVLPLPSAPLPSATPDLRDETVEASRLPTDGWLELARQQMAAGDWRLALRALFLASLSRLAGEGLVTLARFKTNFDYEGELRRRVRERTAVLEEFRARRRQFEDTWYGDHPAESSRVAEWLRQLEGRP